jgi:hypothetical protein
LHVQEVVSHTSRSLHVTPAAAAEAGHVHAHTPAVVFHFWLPEQVKPAAAAVAGQLQLQLFAAEFHLRLPLQGVAGVAGQLHVHEVAFRTKRVPSAGGGGGERST